MQPGPADRLSISPSPLASMLVDERAPVTIITTSGEETSGLLVVLGDDVMTIQADGRRAGRPTYALSVRTLRTR